MINRLCTVVFIISPDVWTRRAGEKSLCCGSGETPYMMVFSALATAKQGGTQLRRLVCHLTMNVDPTITPKPRFFLHSPYLSMHCEVSVVHHCQSHLMMTA